MADPQDLSEILGQAAFLDPAAKLNRGSAYTNRYLGASTEAAGREPNSLSNQSATNSLQSRNSQNAVIQDLLRAAQGDPNSYAQQQLRTGMSQARGGAAAMGTAARGQGAGQAMRGIGAQQSAINAQQNAQSKLLMAQEQMQGRSALLQGLQGMRGLDTAEAGLRAGIQTQSRDANIDTLQALLGGGVKNSIGLANDQLGYQAMLSGDMEARQRLDDETFNNYLNRGLNAASTSIATADKVATKKGP